MTLYNGSKTMNALNEANGINPDRLHYKPEEFIEISTAEHRKISHVRQ
jgi:hypothetical protein